VPAESRSVADAEFDRICARPGLFHRSLFLFSVQLSEFITTVSDNLGLIVSTRKLRLSGG